MNPYRKRKAALLLIIYLAAAVAALAGLAWSFRLQARQQARAAQQQYQHAFHELVTALGELDTALEKSCCATSPALAGALCTEVFGKAMTAQMALGVLPMGAQTLEQTASFISRVGDYAVFLSRSAAEGRTFAPEVTENLRALSDTADVLSRNLRGVEEDLEAGLLRFSDAGEFTALLRAGEAEVPLLGDSLQRIEEEFPEIPALVYDGPFSEHLVGAAPKALEGMTEVTEAQARDNAATFLGTTRSRIVSAGASEGQIPCYCFTADAENGGTVFLCVTKQGGQVLSMLSSRPVGTAATDADAALRTARQFLAEKGFSGMEPTYHMLQGGILTVNYAWKQDGVLCYSDLVKVSVALDTGRVCGFEAAGYLSGHGVRAIPSPGVTEAEARSAVPEGLTLKHTQLALVPSEGKYETLCYEFLCEADAGQQYLIYVNAATGAQHRILILLEDENGALTL